MQFYQLRNERRVYTNCLDHTRILYIPRHWHDSPREFLAIFTFHGWSATLYIYIFQCYIYIAVLCESALTAASQVICSISFFTAKSIFIQMSRILMWITQAAVIQCARAARFTYKFSHSIERLYLNIYSTVKSTACADFLKEWKWKFI